MTRVWFWAPSWHWHGWSTLWPIHVGGDEYGRRTVVVGWTVTGRAIVAISRPGRLYRPEPWEHADELAGIVVRANVYPYGGGERRHGIQLTMFDLVDGKLGSPIAAVRITHEDVGRLGELLDASRRMVWHDPRDADDPYWNPQDGTP